MQAIGIDCRFASSLGGLGTYTREVVCRLISKHPDIQWTLFCREKEPGWLPKTPAHITIVHAPFPQYGIGEQLLFPRCIKRSGVSLLWVPHFNVPFLCPVPFVITVHDMILHRFPNGASFGKRLIYNFLFRWALERAKRILAISHATERELLDNFPRLTQKISLSPLAVGDAFRPVSAQQREELRKKYGLPETFLLYVGNTKEHKNVPLLLRAYEQFHMPHIPLLLVLGNDPGTSLCLPENARILREVPHADLPALYSSAGATVTATLAEGFCLPLLEAMACGSPVLGTNIETLKEVCGEHALLVPPTVEDLACGMREILTGRAASTPASLTYAQSFSWERTAEGVFSALASAL